ncbi:MAG: LacI family transcriptional regulator [Candidatus Pacebacteria bacterium]|nr:LacI family transcriptional regulator [Candidatus Paceibacterota bacterium]
MPNRKPTIKDVARHCGVGIGTVSRAINGKPGVREEIRRKIFQYMEEMGWRSTSLGNRFRLSTRGQTVVIIASTCALERKYYSELPRMLLERLTVRGYSPVVLYGRCRENLAHCLEVKPAAIVVLGVKSYQSDAVRNLLEKGIPVVGIGECGEFSGPVVFPSHRTAARQACERLLAAGHRKIGFFGGMGIVKKAVRREEIYIERIRGMLDGIHDALPGIDLEDSAVSDCFSDLSGLRRKLESGNHTAWIASDEKQCLQFLHCASGLGLRVPDDVSLVGFSPDLPFYAYPVDITRFYPDNNTHVEQVLEIIGAPASPTPRTFTADYLFHPGATVKEESTHEHDESV